VITALHMYGEGLLATARAGGAARVRLREGSVLPLALERYLGPADEIDERLLEGLAGPVLDVGCGPGRHLHALSARGVFALGVDLSPVAVALAVGRGGRAIVGDIFDDLPGGGTWRSALLLDGNIGIGGCPVRLLTRLGSLLHADGVLLVELEPPGIRTGATQARIERDGAVSSWFAWARVAACDVTPIAHASGFTVVAVWSMAGRWFARCTHIDRPADRQQGGGPPPPAGAYSVL
jgi:SAM-dependent methyltransferase